MKIAVRMDDITPDMNWDNFRFFQKLFEEVGIKPLLGIVPDNRDKNLHKEEPHQDFYEVMRNLRKQGYVLSMHGCHHIYSTKKGGIFPLNNFSEFAGVSYTEQKKMLEEGKRSLEENGIVTDIFMAPAHSYDKNTLRALKELGFTRITDGFGKRPYTYKGMTFYPISFQLSRSLKQKSGYTTMVLHANTITEKDKERYSKIFREHEKDMISYSEYLEAKAKKRNCFGRCTEYLLAKVKFLLTSIRNR